VNISKHLFNGKKIEIMKIHGSRKKKRRDKVIWQDSKIKKNKKKIDHRDSIFNTLGIVRKTRRNDSSYTLKKH
jgi:hypothetical protein